MWVKMGAKGLLCMQINTRGTSAAGFRELNGGQRELQRLHLEHNRCLCQLKSPPVSPPLLHYPLASESRGKVCGLGASRRARMGDKHRGGLRGVQLSEAAWFPQQQPPPQAGKNLLNVNFSRKRGEKNLILKSHCLQGPQKPPKTASRDILGPFGHQRFVLSKFGAVNLQLQPDFIAFMQT